MDRNIWADHYAFSTSNQKEAIDAQRSTILNS
jgi:hypothetical protein